MDKSCRKIFWAINPFICTSATLAFICNFYLQLWHKIVYFIKIQCTFLEFGTDLLATMQCNGGDNHKILVWTRSSDLHQEQLSRFVCVYAFIGTFYAELRWNIPYFWQFCTLPGGTNVPCMEVPRESSLQFYK